MRCQSCGKKEANVKYYEDINGIKQTLYFCENCAKKLGFSDFSGFSSLFSPIFTTMPEFNLLEKRKCNVCGYTIDEYLNSGMLGCEECYNTFEDNIDELLYKINGKSKHIKLGELKKVKSEAKLKNSKVEIKGDKVENKKETNEKKICKLKEKLEQLIETENYEEAAVIRDEIKRIKEDREG